MMGSTRTNIMPNALISAPPMLDHRPTQILIASWCPMLHTSPYIDSSKYETHKVTPNNPIAGYFQLHFQLSHPSRTTTTTTTPITPNNPLPLHSPLTPLLPPRKHNHLTIPQLPRRAIRRHNLPRHHLVRLRVLEAVRQRDLVAALCDDAFGLVGQVCYDVDGGGAGCGW